MATVKFSLKEGLKVGENVYIAAEIREATAGDLIDAADESEKLISTPDGYQLLASPTLVGLNTLRRQILCIGDYKGPLTLSELKKLSAADLSLLQENAMALEDASLKKVITRGE